jgi:cell division protease FtsH
MPKSGGGFPFSVKAGKLNTSKNSKTKFADVAGMDEVKMELSEIVDYLKNPVKYNKVGARHPK